MERNEIVKIFLDKGYMIDTTSLDFFSENQTMVQPFLDYYSDLEDKTGSIDINLVQEILKIKISSLQIIKTANKKQKISVSDQSTFLNKRFDAIKKIMNNRLDLINLVSINKISQKSKKFSLIGIVKNKNDETKSLILEDTTGEVELFFSENFFSDYDSILHDDILGFICSNEFGRYYYIKTVWPDIPLTREVKKTKENYKCIFACISDLNEVLTDWLNKSADEESAIFIFPVGDNKNVKKIFEKLPHSSVKYLVDGTSIISLSGLTFFLSNNQIYKKYQEFFKTTPEATLTNLVKRRNMNPSLDFDKSVYDDDPFILDQVPDVIVVSTLDEQSVSNYKGTNVLTIKDFALGNSVLVLDTKTREVIKIGIL
ncbi:MAG: hypothetical protein J4452_03035 [Candidatus Aenigmarchaeota archaeon]|nr:hypothetical protein [Candidatus Aenigmarchaeota archaeon]